MAQAEESKSSQAAGQLSQAEALKAKKAAAAKKKAALLAKMKKKQSGFINDPAKLQVSAVAAEALQSSSTENNAQGNDGMPANDSSS